MNRSSGVTLLELLIVLVIVAILGAVGYPSYLDYITRSNRAVAKGMMVMIADRQEQFFADNKRYAANLTELGFAANAFMIDDQGTAVADDDGERLYGISLTNTSATTFTVNAAPELRQATHDTQCGTLTLAQGGLRGTSGGGDRCW